uniref:uncharacterized protein LOC122607087 n=1 Tax=Erigeron canadensis TaxID=72917 RepID=UPI001CB8ECF6|nr:uncharacterized protein LOC122607087 [Erigeron canadensis]XP_043635948.1 uncharacterized protein LOC122607087 [Erigeron canadensis]
MMVREKDVCWEYAEKLDGNKVKCKFCLRVLNGGISRLKHHLSRLPSKGVNPCSKVKDDVTDRVRAIIASKDDSKEVPLTKMRKRDEPRSPISMPTTRSLVTHEISSPITRFFPDVTLNTPSHASDQEDAERSVALFFFENKLDFSVTRSSSYQQMIDSVSKCGNGFDGPTPETLKNKWLEIIKSEVNLQCKESEKEWSTTGCTIIVETWTDNKSRALINFLISSPSSTFFHKSVDASSYFKSTKFLADLFDSVIQDFGPDNIVQIILDNTLNCTSIVNHISETYGTIFVSPCASQCLNAILKEFSNIDWVNRCILQAQVISKFIYNQSSLLDMMKKFTAGEDIIKTGITKYVSHFLSLRSMLKQRSRLKHMFNSPEFTNNPAYANKSQGMTCIGLLDDNEFWRTVEECVAVSEPFLKVMREVSSGKPAVGLIYELMTKAKESIRTYYIMDDIKCKIFFDIVDQKWQSHLHSPLHSAAAFLNPVIQYNPETKFLGSIKEDFYRVLEKLLPTPELRRDITNQILLFTRASGMFGCSLSKEAIDAVLPGIWWEQYGDAAPTLQRVAMRILSQVCSTTPLKKHWSTFQEIHSEKRNKINKETLNDIAFIHYNLKLARSKKSVSTDTDPIQLDDIDMTSPWAEETENSSPTQWLDRFGPSLECNDLNTRQFSNSIFGPNDHLFNL